MRDDRYTNDEAAAGRYEWFRGGAADFDPWSEYGDELDPEDAAYLAVVERDRLNDEAASRMA